MVGLGRDIVTGSDAKSFEVIDEARFDITASPRREILEIACDPLVGGIEQLVGARAGGHSRALLAEALAEQQADGKVIYQLLDDFAGASLVAGWAWSRWTDLWAESRSSSDRPKLPKMVGICAGFRPGAGSLTEEGTPRHDIQSSAPVPDLRNPDDHDGLHVCPRQTGVGMRRARWLDVSATSVGIAVQTGFQDRATDPGGGRVAVHEYRVDALIDPRDLILTSLEADPRILPYAACSGAVGHTERLLGKRISAFRRDVIETLPGTLGCTHLNDVLRALADIPRAISVIEKAQPKQEN